MASHPDSSLAEPIPLPRRQDLRADLVWRCADCGYQRQSPERPERCPACSAGTERLEGKTSIEWRLLMRRRPAV